MKPLGFMGPTKSLILFGRIGHRASLGSPGIYFLTNTNLSQENTFNTSQKAFILLN